jgi:hypothetical protein
MRSCISRLHILIPAAYLVGAVVVWIDFCRLLPDGLANSGIALNVTRREFPFFEGGYDTSHTVYFAASVLLLTALLFLALKVLFHNVQRGP